MSAKVRPFLRRTEYKYLIPNHLVPPIRRTLQGICRPDPHARSDGFYSVRSLYLDTAALDLYWANEHEKGDRFKARIRCYPGTNTYVFLEVKARSGDAIIKTSATVKTDRWKDVIETSDGMDREALNPDQRRQAEHFLALVHTYHLEPKVLVEYDREAYVSSVDDYARVTLDRKIKGQMKKHLDLSVSPAQWRLIDHPVRTTTAESVWILELKFGQAVPVWMSALVRGFELSRFEFSKYCYSLGELLSLPGLRASSRS